MGKLKDTDGSFFLFTTKTELTMHKEGINNVRTAIEILEASLCMSIIKVYDGP